MRTIIAAMVLVVFAVTAASAQPNASDPTPAQIHRGKTKMWIGVGLVGAGLLMIPWTGATQTGATQAAAQDNRLEGPAVWTGLGLMAIGSCIIWWGAQERRQAVPKPQMTFGVVLGRNNGVQIRRVW
jgi:hypothetical protein